MVGIGCQLDRLWNRHGDKPLGMLGSAYLEWLLEVGKTTVHMVGILPMDWGPGLNEKEQSS